MSSRAQPVVLPLRPVIVFLPGFTSDGQFNSSIHIKALYQYIYFACLSVCLFVTDKRQNGETDWAQILCGTSHDPREGI